MAGGHGGGLLFHIDGIGGHIDVFADRIVLHRHGFVHFWVELLKLYEGSTETVIPLSQISSMTIVQPVFLPGYARFTYPGSPVYSPHYWVDAMQPNTMLMGYVDNRGFHRLKRMLDGRPPAVIHHDHAAE